MFGDYGKNNIKTKLKRGIWTIVDQNHMVDIDNK
jgi:hypothetical protein